MKEKNIENRTVEELENDYWPNLPGYPSTLIEQVYSIRKKKLADMGANDIRVMISQEVGLKFLIPCAIRLLEKNVLEEALYYPGDLLMSVLKVNKDYWENNLDEKAKLTQLITKSKISIEQSPEIYDDKIVQSLQAEIDRFTNLSS